jgi:hypothetical protein
MRNSGSGLSAAPVTVDDQLRIRVPGGNARLTPRGALALAEELTRRGFRRMLVEEAEVLPVGSAGAGHTT